MEHVEAVTQPSRAATRAVAASARNAPETVPLPLAALGDSASAGALSDAGATMVEYGLMVALVALVALLAVTAFGISVTDLVDNPALLDALA